MVPERYIPYNPSSPEELEERERRRVSTNAFIQDVDRQLYNITETPPYPGRTDPILELGTLLIREHHLEQLCYKVESLISNNSPLTVLNLDFPEGVTEHPIGSVSYTDEGDIEEAFKCGKREAVTDLLHVLRPNSDLLRTLAPFDEHSQAALDAYAIRWRRDILKDATNHTLLSDVTDGIKQYQGGIMTLELKTRLPTVLLSLVYGPGEEFPQRYLYSTDKI